MLFRKTYKKIDEWYKSRDGKALMVTGARQIGKTFLIKHFLKDNVKSYIEFNLFENDLAKDAFETSKTAKELLLKISALANAPLIKNETVIFIDEVQFAREVITKIKFLLEEGSYRYILSGSILGVELNNVNSLPVGYMDIIEMYPLDFEEFSIANGVSNRIFDYLYDCYKNKKEIDWIIHEQMMKLFNLYVIIGGLPEAVNKYIKTNNLQEVYSAHENIDKLYRLDISKYDLEDSLLIKDIYDLIPSELNNQNKRFILKNLNEKARFYQYETSFRWLLNSNIGLFVHNIDNPVYPLLASKERNLFKLFLCDTGLLSFKMFKENSIKILNNNQNVNFGALYESVVAQELCSKNINLFYYNSKKNGEMDFIIEDETDIIPIEVKSGKDYKRHLALENLINNPEYKIKYSITLCNGNVETNGKKIYLPIYMIMFIDKKEKNDEDFIYKINIDSLK